MASPSDLTTPAMATSFAGFDVADPLLPLLISAASEQVAKAVGYALHSRTETQHLASSGGPYLWAACGQLTAIESLSINGQALAPELYALDNSKHARIRTLGSPFPRTAYWGGTPDQTPIIPRPVIELVGTFGWVTPAQATESLERTLPADLELAALLAVAQARDLAASQGIASQSLGGTAVTFSAVRVTLSAAALAICRSYKTSRSLVGG